MIYTVTFNPSLDYVIGAEKLEPGKINRTTRENIYPGGKGNNVSVAVIPILSSWITDLPESM